MKVLKMFVVSDDKVCEPVRRMSLLKGHGIEGDKHAGNGSRHVSILAHSSLMTMREKGYDVKPEDFHINMLISGLNPHNIKVGDVLEVEDVLLEVVQIGSLSEEQPHCDIYKQCGTCIMHTEGIFASVIKSGDVVVGDRCYQ